MLNHLFRNAVLVLFIAVTASIAVGQQSMHHPQSRPIDGELLRAVSQRDVPCVRSLLADGADPNYTTNTAHWVVSVLSAALPRSGEDDDVSKVREIIKALMSAGLRLSPTEPAYAITMVNIAIVGDTQGLDLLLEFGADINARGPKGITFLVLAASEGDERFIRHLLERGADPCQKDDNGVTAAEQARRSATESSARDPEGAQRVAFMLDAACAQRQPN